MSDINKLKEQAARRLRNLLESNNCMPILQGQAFYRCGLGLHEDEFDEVVQGLVTQNYLARDMTRRGKFVLRKNVQLEANQQQG